MAKNKYPQFRDACVNAHPQLSREKAFMVAKAAWNALKSCIPSQQKCTEKKCHHKPPDDKAEKAIKQLKENASKLKMRSAATFSSKKRKCDRCARW